MKQPVKLRIVTNGEEFKIQRWCRRLGFLWHVWIDEKTDINIASAKVSLVRLNKLWNPKPWVPVPSDEPVVRAIEEANQDDAA